MSGVFGTVLPLTSRARAVKRNGSPVTAVVRRGVIKTPAALEPVPVYVTVMTTGAVGCVVPGVDIGKANPGVANAGRGGDIRLKQVVDVGDGLPARIGCDIGNRQRAIVFDHPMQGRGIAYGQAHLVNRGALSFPRYFVAP